MKRELMISAAVKTVAFSLVWTSLACGQVTPLDRYADDNPYNDIPTSPMNTERGGTLKSADPRPIPGTDPHADRGRREVRRQAPPRDYRTAEPSSYRPAPPPPANYDNTYRGVAVPPAPAVVPPPQTQPSMQNGTYASDGVDYRYIKPADPAVVNPDYRGNGGVDRVLASDRYLNTSPNVSRPIVPSQSAASDELAVKRDYSTNPLDSTRDPAFRQPVLTGPGAPDTGAPFDQTAQPAGGRVVPENTRSPWDTTTRPSNLEPDTGRRTQPEQPPAWKGERAPGQYQNERNVPPQTDRPPTDRPQTDMPQTDTPQRDLPRSDLQRSGTSPGSSVDNSALNRNNLQTDPNAIPGAARNTAGPEATARPGGRNDLNATQNDATLDLPAIRTTLSGFVDAALGGAGSGNWADMIARNDRERLGSSGTSSDEELTRLSAELRDTWRTKYGTEIRGNNTTIAVSEGFRILSPSMLEQRDGEARLAGERAAPNTPGQEPQRQNQEPQQQELPNQQQLPQQQPQRRMRTEAVGNTGDEAVVIIPVAAICVESGASPRSKAGPATPDVTAGAADRARGAIAEGTGTAVEKAGDAANRVGRDGNRLGEDLNRAGDTMQQQGRQLQDRGDEKARAHGGKYATVADRRVRLVREDGQWKIDLPDSKDGTAFRRELTENLRALNARKEQWPADQSDAYRMLAAHVLSAAAE